MTNMCETFEKLVLLVTPTTPFSVDNHYKTLANELAHTSTYRLGRYWVSLKKCDLWLNSGFQGRKTLGR